MDETIQHYREIRTLLEALVASWPWDRPGAAVENAKVYLDFHCAGCGDKLSINDLAVVLELEMLRLGTADARRVPFFAPICTRCYIRRAAPAGHCGSTIADTVLGDTAPRLAEAALPPAPRPPAQLERSQPLHSAQRAWWRHAETCLLVVAMLLVVLALGIALSNFSPLAHTSTFRRPTAPAVTTTTAPTSLSNSRFFM